MLYYGNIASDQNVLVLDYSVGLLLASVADRIQGHGRIFSLVPNKKGNSTHVNHPVAVQGMNFSREILSRIHYVNQSQLSALFTQNEETEKVQMMLLGEISPNFLLNSLIIASPFECESTLFSLLPLLQISGNFVIHSQILESLSKCFHKLITENVAVNVQLNTTWYREYQILPRRTHPMMSMNGEAGYILSGIKIDNSRELANSREEEKTECEMEITSEEDSEAKRVKSN